MRCVICLKESDEVDLFDGIYDADIVHVCESCAEEEGIPLIKTPSQEQLHTIDQKPGSVRERMERLSGTSKRFQGSGGQELIHGAAPRLRSLPQKQYHEDVLDDYYWTLNMARRRRKLSTKQLAETLGIDEEILISIEKGRIPENFEEIFLLLEDYFDIRLLKDHKARIHFKRSAAVEENILEEVEKIMGEREEGLAADELALKEERMDKLSKGELDFSDQGALERITLNDLVEIKRRKDALEAEKKTKEQTDAMIGEDLDIEVDERGVNT